MTILVSILIFFYLVGRFTEGKSNKTSTFLTGFASGWFGRSIASKRSTKSDVPTEYSNALDRFFLSEGKSIDRNSRYYKSQLKAIQKDPDLYRAVKMMPDRHRRLAEIQRNFTRLRKEIDEADRKDLQQNSVKPENRLIPSKKPYIP